MSLSRQLLRRNITYSEAKTEDVNILHQLSYAEARQSFFTHLDSHRDQIEDIVSGHLGLSRSKKRRCSISPGNEWIDGSFNVVIPLNVEGWNRRVIIRFPLPYKIGEAFRPGNADEKLRCEAATYAWLSENCPNVPIPHLWGFGLSTGQRFTAVEHTSIFTRCLEYIRHALRSLLGHPLPSRYVRSDHLHLLDVGYLVTDFVDKGSMLSNTWEEQRQDDRLRGNLFRDLSRIILSIGRVSQPRIGSFTIDSDGHVSLTNRPLTCEMQQLENECIPIDMPRDLTYSTTDSYAIDLLHNHRARLVHQPNAAHDLSDCLDQVAALSVMESVRPSFFSRDLRRGPFGLTLTDLHNSNIFVDDDWHITSLVDLEWACTLPPEMQHPPHWFTSHAVDHIEPEAYDEVRKEFMDVFKEEEKRLASVSYDTDYFQRTDIMQQGWSSGNFWYCLALNSPTGLYHLLYKRIQPLFSKTDTDEVAFYSTASHYWVRDFGRFGAAKVKAHEEYIEQLRKAFDVL